MERLAFDPNFDEFGDYTQRAIQTLETLDDSSQHMTPFSTIRANQHVIRSTQYVVNNDTPDYENLKPYYGPKILLNGGIGLSNPGPTQ